MTGEEVRRLARHVADVERELENAHQAVSVGHWPDAREALDDVKRALDVLFDNCQRGIG